MNEFTSKEIRDQIEYISFIVETDLHQAVSPDNWSVYSELHDEIEELIIMLQENKII